MLWLSDASFATTSDQSGYLLLEVVLSLFISAVFIAASMCSVKSALRMVMINNQRIICATDAASIKALWMSASGLPLTISDIILQRQVSLSQLLPGARVMAACRPDRVCIFHYKWNYFGLKTYSVEI